MIQTRQIRGKNGCFGKGTEVIEVPDDKNRCGGCYCATGPFFPMEDKQFCGYCFQRRQKGIPHEGIDPELVKRVKE